MKTITKLAFGAIGGYTTYTSYLYYEARRQIRLRENTSDEFKSLKIHGRYENPFLEYRPQTIYEFLLMRMIEFSRFEERRGGVPVDPADVHEQIGWESLDGRKLEEISAGCVGGKIGYTWLGQSCGLFHVEGCRFLMDPMFSDWMIDEKFGPRRILPFPVGDLKDLRADYVLVSHDHPDHLDYESVKKAAANGDVKKWIIPVGLGVKLLKCGVANDKIVELDWWEKTTVGEGNEEFEIVCLPAMHWSGQHVVDTNESLWCSFIVRKNGKSLFYHGGDTGYVNKLFQKMGDLYGPVQLAALPVGQYCPEWHQRPRHINPGESLKIIQEMDIKKMVGVHWGTFVLSSEHYLEPREKLIKEATEKCVLEKVVVPTHGGTVFHSDK